MVQPKNSYKDRGFIISSDYPDCQFLVFCNSPQQTLEAGIHLQELLGDNQDQCVWLHSGMSEQFKDEVVILFQNGKMMGMVCTDSLGMVHITSGGTSNSLFLTCVIQ